MNKRIPLLFVLQCIVAFANCQICPAKDNYDFYKTNKVSADFTSANQLTLACANQVFSANPNPSNPNGVCEAKVILKASANSPSCTSTDLLKWKVLVDFDSNDSIDFEFSSFLPTSDNLNLLTDSDKNGILDRYVPPTENDKFVITPEFELAMSYAIHRVTWEVTDGCGSVTQCHSTFTVVDKKSPTPYCVSLSSALCENGIVELWAVDFNKGSFDNCTPQNELFFTLNDERPVTSKMNEEHFFKGAGLEATEAEYNNSMAQKWVPSYRSSARIYKCNAVIDVNMSVWDSELNTDFCKVTMHLAGCGGGSIAGKLETKSQKSINKVGVKIDGNIAEFPKFGVFDGTYFFGVKQVSDYSLSATKDDFHANGVTTLDLILMQRHLLGISKLESPENLIAGDVNKDGKINATDLVEVKKLILGLYDKFPNNSSWVFFPKSYNFNDPTNPKTNPIFKINIDRQIRDFDFIGIKIGDVNDSNNPSADKATDVVSSNTLKLVLTDQSVNYDDQISIPVTSNNFNDVHGFQFTADISGLTIISLKNGAIDVKETYATPSFSNFAMSFASEIPLNVDPNTPLFTIIAKVNKKGKLSDMINIVSENMEPQSYVGNEMTINKLDLTFEQKNELAFTLFQNEPNPFNTSTIVKFYSPIETNVVLTLSDVSGKVLSVKNIAATRGLNRVEYNRNEFAKGLIYYTLSSDEYKMTKEMIVVE
jgi:hypothetical protein